MSPRRLEALGHVAYGQGNYAEAVRLRREVLALRRRLLGDSNSKTTTALLELTTAMHAQGDFKGAQPLMDEWVVDRHPSAPETTEVARTSSWISPSVYQYRQRRISPSDSGAKRPDIYRALYGDRHPKYANALALARLDHRREGGTRPPPTRCFNAASTSCGPYIPMVTPISCPRFSSGASRSSTCTGIQDAEPRLREEIAMARRFEGNESLDPHRRRAHAANALSMTGSRRSGRAGERRKASSS